MTLICMFVQQQWKPESRGGFQRGPLPSSTYTSIQYSPGSLNRADTSAFPSGIAILSPLNVIVPGPRYLDHVTVRPPGGAPGDVPRPGLGFPSSFADTEIFASPPR